MGDLFRGRFPVVFLDGKRLSAESHSEVPVGVERLEIGSDTLSERVTFGNCGVAPDHEIRPEKCGIAGADLFEGVPVLQ
jgi:hypothetical protein